VGAKGIYHIVRNNHSKSLNKYDKDMNDFILYLYHLQQEMLEAALAR